MGSPGRSPAIAQRLVSAYITSLRQHLPTSSIRQIDQLPAASEQQLSLLQRAYPTVPLELVSVLARVNGTCWEALKTPVGSETSAAAAPDAVASTGAATKAASAAEKTTLSTPPSPASSSSSALKSTAASYLRATFKGGSGTSEKRRVKIAVPIFGSALGACPYYLMSVDQMLSAKPFLPPPWKNGARQPAYGDALSEGTPRRGPGHDTIPTSATATTTDRADDTDVRSPCTIASLYDGFRVISDPAEAAAAEAERQAEAAGQIIGGQPGSSSPSGTGTSSALASGAAGTATAATSTSPAQKLHKLIVGKVGVMQGAGTAGGSLIPPVPTPAVSAPSSPTVDAMPTPSAVSPSTAVDKNHWVYVDPRIDVHADLSHWLGFADSIYPHHQREIEVKQHLKSLSSASKSTASSPVSDSPLPLYKTCESRLFVDFSPSPLGTSGQIVQFVRGGQRTTKRRVALYLREEEPIENERDITSAGTAVTVGECDSFVVIASDFGEYLKLLIREEYEFTEDLEDEEDEEDDDKPSSTKR